jgi:hypothetical protein
MRDNCVLTSQYMKANALNQVTFKITPHDFAIAQKASLEM